MLLPVHLLQLTLGVLTVLSENLRTSSPAPTSPPGRLF